jgi:hypothetical protein
LLGLPLPCNPESCGIGVGGEKEKEMKERGDRRSKNRFFIRASSYQFFFFFFFFITVLDAAGILQTWEDVGNKM